MSRRPSVSVILTLHDRPQEVISAVLSSLDGQGQEQSVMVFDRCQEPLRSVTALESIRFLRKTFRDVQIQGNAGWRCPSAAWNAGFKAATGDILFCLSSDVVQQPGNVEKARRFLSEIDAVLFGVCVESDPERAAKDPTTTPILCTAAAPRPLGFIMALPRWAVEAIGGYDEVFMGGQWQEDRDFTWRLWDLGLHFAFWDEISGVHQTHDRAFLDWALIERNREIFIAKWGYIDRDLAMEARTIRPESGLTIWANPNHSRLAARREVA